jgi:signal transduction histidine kinase
MAEERVRIARELHDGMAQVLAYVNTKAQAVQEYLRSGRPEQAEQHLEQLAAAAREVYTDAREGIFGLRSGSGPEVPFARALGSYLETWSEQTGIEVEAQGLGESPLPLGMVAELQLLRIVQEALSNVRKHARARRVSLVCSRQPERVEIIVIDDGQGFDPEHTVRRGFPRFGLATMRERAEAVGGRLEVESTPGAGTRVRVSLPVEGGNR